MKLLLDTDAFLWFVLDDVKLSDNARHLIANAENEILISPANYWEIAIKISLGKYSLSEDFANFMSEQLEANEMQILAITIEHADVVSKLPFHHRDPFDRLMVAQSLVEGIPFISGDQQLDKYSISRKW